MEGGIFYRIRLSSKIERWLFCKLTVKMCMMDDLLTLEIKARNKALKVLVVFVGQAVVRADILSFLSTINICPVINVILTPQW